MTNQSAYKSLKEPRQARSRVTYDAILEAAAQLLPGLGYAGTTTNRIAERAGVSIGSVYEYFPGKDAIFATLKERLDEETIGLVLEPLQDIANDSPHAVLAGVLKARINAALHQPELEALLRTEIPASVFGDQQKRSFELFASAMRAFAANHPEAIRIQYVEAGIDLGVRVVELTVTDMAANRPEMLRDPEVVSEFVDMMTRWILRD